MSLLEALILGVIQGLTEFLPVSSSGHLELGKFLLGDNSMPRESMMFTVVLHFATALSTLLVFRKEVASILMGLLEFRNNEPFQFSLKILLSMIPAGLVGFFYSEQLERLFDKQILLVGLMLLVTGLLLFVADRSRDTDKDVSFIHALVLGLAQAIAILPGISRSGATISTAVLLGIDRTKAASFSFLMVVPLILGKITKDLLDGALVLKDDQLLILIGGFTAAFLTGIVACKWMISLVQKAQLKYFAYYCFVVGTLAILADLTS